MSFQYMPLYTGDYLRDTRFLTPLKHGIYLLCLVHCWDSKGPMPLDEQEAAGICNCRSADEIESLRYVLDRFFIRMDDGHYNMRMQREVERSESISGARSEAGKLGYQAKAKQLLSKSKASATTISPSPSPSHSPTPKNTGDSAVAQALTPPPAFLGDENKAEISDKARVAIAPAWELPTAWGEDAEQLGFKPHEILHQSIKFKQYWTAGKGLGTRRSLKGWRQSWSNWLSKAETLRA